MIKRLTLNEIELNVLVEMRAISDLMGSMPGPVELAEMAGVSARECRAAIESLVDRGLSVCLPDGGWMPVSGG